MTEYYLNINHLLYHKDYTQPTKEDVIHILTALYRAADDLNMFVMGTSDILTEEDL